MSRLISLAGFGVSLIGRFSGVPRGSRHLQPDAFMQGAEKRLKEIEKGMRAEKVEVKDELWSLIVEYIRMLRAWPNEIPIREPFMLQWRPTVGQTQYGQDVAAAMKWVRELDTWIRKADGRLNGIAELELTKSRNGQRAINEGALGALPLLLQALVRIDAQL